MERKVCMEQQNTHLPVALLELAHGRSELDLEMDLGVILTHHLESDVLTGLIAAAVLVAHVAAGEEMECLIARNGITLFSVIFGGGKISLHET